ncbi:hypothetical protein PflQ8_3519 [Pseudomonas fluorescens Q8r1-96]|nr:hypothetical protein PflQ8_3519 [Pseudomonas fluorescens Q8r1-96]
MDITMRPFRPTVFDVAKYFDDRMTIGYSDHAIRVKRPARPRLGCCVTGQRCSHSCFSLHRITLGSNVCSWPMVACRGGQRTTQSARSALAEMSRLWSAMKQLSDQQKGDGSIYKQINPSPFSFRISRCQQKLNLDRLSSSVRHKLAFFTT